MKINKKQISVILGIIILLVLSILMVFHPLNESFCVGKNSEIYAWQYKWLATLYPVFLCFSILLAAFIAYCSKKNFKQEESVISRVVTGVTPFVWLFPCVWMSYSGQWVGVMIAALFIPFGFAIIFALVLDNLFFKPFKDDMSSLFTKRLVFISTVIYAVFFSIYYLSEVGEMYVSGTGGDVKHYVIMHNSLLNDGNLDLSNELEKMRKDLNVPKENIAALAKRSHMKQNLEGKYYSYHSFGLPIISFVFASVLGDFGVLLLVILIAVLATLGCLKLSLLSGGNKRGAVILSWLLALSCGWVFAAIAFLPEMLGLALTAWGFWGVLALAHENLRHRAIYVVALCAGYLPYAHVRFTPISLLLVCFFGIEYLFFVKDEKFWKKIKRLIIPVIIYVCMGVYLLYCHMTMYSGNSAYKYDRVLLGYPLAMWLVLCAQRSLGSVMPCVFGMLASIPFVLSRGGRKTRIALYALGIFVGILITCCSTRAALGGACIPGRYLLHSIPILLPVVVIAFSEGVRIVRLLYMALALLPVFAFFIMGDGAKSTPGRFIRLPEKIYNYPCFENLLDPFASLDVTSNGFLWGSIFAVCIILCFVFLYFSCINKVKKTFTVLACIIFCIAIYFGMLASNYNLEAKRDNNGLSLMKDKYQYLRLDSETTVDVFNLFDTGNEKSIFQYGRGFQSVTGRTYDSLAYPVNDWDGRDRRWIDLLNNRVNDDADGGIAVYLKGRVENGSFFLQMRQGANNISDEMVFNNSEIEGIWILPIREGKGLVYSLVSIDNLDAKLTMERIDYVPYSKYFNRDMFKFPKDIPVYDLR